MLAALVGHLLAQAATAGSPGNMNWKGSKNYVVILDAGSTGTRSHAFHYPAREMSGQLPFNAEGPVTLPQPFATFSATPGLSAFVNATDGLKSYLGGLMNSTVNAVKFMNPSVKAKHVPVFLGATAGLRTLTEPDRAKVMKAVRKVLFSEVCPFRFAYKEQARVLSGSEEGAFDWLAVNYAKASITADANATYGAIDIGGGSVQISFIPMHTSILDGLFPMHLAHIGAAINLYVHSFLQFGKVDAFQRASSLLYQRAVGSSVSKHGIAGTGADMTGAARAVVDHPCLPSGLVWHVKPGEYGVSTTVQLPERLNGSIEFRGAGDFKGCRDLARQLMVEAPCFLPPCSIMGVYQPELKHNRFVLFGAYALWGAWELPLLHQQGMPWLVALRRQLQRACAMPLSTQESLWGGQGLTNGEGEPPCWLGSWFLTLLIDGFGFQEDTNNVVVFEDCCDHAVGHALYEINFFPYKIVSDEARGSQANRRRRSVFPTGHESGAVQGAKQVAPSYPCSATLTGPVAAAFLVGGVSSALLLRLVGRLSSRRLGSGPGKPLLAADA